MTFSPTRVKDASSQAIHTRAPKPDDAARRMNVVVGLMGLSVLINYIDRSNLSIAAPLIKDELGITGTQLGTLLSAFFYTYGLLQIPAGWLVDRFDVKWVFAFGFFVWCASTAVTGLVHGFAALLLARIVLGVGESIEFPSCGKIIGSHFQENRRGFANSIVMTGLALGPALGLWIGGNAIGRFGWRPFFIALGLIGLFWLVPWSVWMPNRTGQASSINSLGPSGIVAILRQRSAWGTCLCLFCFNYTSYLLVTWLPFYLMRDRGLSMREMARAGALVYLLYAAACAGFGKLSDIWVNGGASPTTVRKTLATAGYAGMGLFLAVTAVMPSPAFLWTLAVTGIFLGMATCNIWAMTQTLAGPQMVGRWTGIQNFVGNFAGAVAPWLTGFLLDRTGHFYWAFFITTAIAWIGALSWIFIVGRIEPVEWSPQPELP
jgi:ACS family D-galactonate transporter-like MFS transporter